MSRSISSVAWGGELARRHYMPLRPHRERWAAGRRAGAAAVLSQAGVAGVTREQRAGPCVGRKKVLGARVAGDEKQRPAIGGISAVRRRALLCPFFVPTPAQKRCIRSHPAGN
jgi:hypothetical protein